jgi:hypothetical protein
MSSEQDLRKYGLGPILDEAIDMIPECRRKNRSNDVVIFVFIESNPNNDMSVCRFYGAPRSVAKTTLEATIPSAVKTIAQLEKPPTLDEVLLVIQRKQDLFSCRIPVDPKRSGVQN